MQIEIKSIEAKVSARQFTIRGILQLTVAVAICCCVVPVFLRWITPAVQTLPSPYYITEDLEYFPANSHLVLPMKRNQSKDDDSNPMSKSPDKFENSLRFGCGGIFGAGFGMIALMRILPASSSAFTILTCIILFVVVSGLLAVRFGDLYWEVIVNWLR